MKCVNCKHCVNFADGYYWCDIGNEITPIEESIANDDDMGCEFYEYELDAYFTKRQ